MGVFSRTLNEMLIILPYQALSLSCTGSHKNFQADTTLPSPRHPAAYTICCRAETLLAVVF